MTGDAAAESRDERPAVTGAPIDGDGARHEAIAGDDQTAADEGDAYPSDGASPDRGSSAPRD